MDLNIAYEYFKLFLMNLRCDYITTTDFDDETQAIGFQCENSDYIQNLLNVLNLHGHIYKENDQCTLIISNAQLVKNLQKHLQHIFNQWQNSHREYSGYYEGRGFNFEHKGELSGYYEGRGFYFKYEHDYNFLITHRDLLTSLREIGLDNGEHTLVERVINPEKMFSMKYCAGTPYDDLMPYFLEKKKWYGFLVVTDPKKLFNLHGKSFIPNIDRAAQTTLFMGLFSKSGSHSSLKKMHDNTLFERKLIPEIFSYAKAVEPKKEIAERKLNHNIPSIDSAIVILDQEIKSPYYLFNIDRKKLKIAFLRLILAIKKTNPAMSTKICIEIAIKERPELYREAMKGYWRNRTFNLIEELKKQPAATMSVNNHIAPS